MKGSITRSCSGDRKLSFRGTLITFINMTLSRSFLFISIACIIGQCNRAVLCAKGDDRLQFNNENSVPQSIDVSGKGTLTSPSEEINRPRRELENVDLETDSTNLTDEERSARCLLGSRRHLKKNDADRVAKYFLNGGPSIGNSHFVGSSNAPCTASDDDQNNIVGTSNPTDENYKQSSTNENNLNAQLHDPYVGVPHTPALYTIPGSIPNVNPYIPAYAPIVGKINSLFNHRYTKPRIRARDGILGSILRSHLHPYIHELRNIPHNLLRTVASPVNGILNASPAPNNWFSPYPFYRQNEHFVGSINSVLEGSENKSKPVVDSNSLDGKDSTTSYKPNPESNSGNAKTSMQEVQPIAIGPIPVQQQFLTYPQPTAYMVRLVPHYAQNVPVSPHVHFSGSPYHRGSYGAPVVGAPIVGTSKSNTEHEVESTTAQIEAESINDDQSTRTTKENETDCKVLKREATFQK